MQLIGMLDSPFARRVAIELLINKIPFEHRSVSVFRQMDEFGEVNPLFKAPSLICDDGEVLMESSLILDYIWNVVAPEKALMPAGKARQHALRLIGIGLVAAEKAVQIEYERKRPEAIRHAPWMERINAQLHAALALLEPEVAKSDPWLFGQKISQADITVAIAWKFQDFVLKDVVTKGQYPALEQFSARAEALPEFLATPLD
jgi:glutathione S-transferase